MIEIFDGNLTKKDIKHNSKRRTCRAVVEKDGKYLVVHETKWDVTMFPGGGLEPGETLEECCKREVLEETGIEVTIQKQGTTILEHYENGSFESNYFLCSYVKDTGTVNFTEIEQEVGLETKWLTAEELLDNWANNMTKHEYGPNIHNREFLAFTSL